MKTYERNGITYRLLQHGEQRQLTDMIAYRNCITRDRHWVQARYVFRFGVEGESVPKYFAFLREVDPLIAAMIKAKKKHKK